MIGHCKYCLCSLSILSIWTQEHNRRQASHGSFPFSIFIHHGLFHFSTHQQTKEPFWNILVLIERKGKKKSGKLSLSEGHVFTSSPLKVEGVLIYVLEVLKESERGIKTRGAQQSSCFGPHMP